MTVKAMLGVDVSKPRLDCALWQPASRKWHSRRTDNSGPAARALVAWVVGKAQVEPSQIRVVLEATGPYHEEAAEAFHAAGCEVVVANPQRVRSFTHGTGQLNKNDPVDARALARYGEEAEKFSLWTPPPEPIRVLKALLARIDAVEQDLQRERNRLEKAQSAPTPEIVVESLQRGIRSLEIELKRLTSELDDHIDRHPDLKRDEKLLETIPGIGQTTARRLLGLLRGRTFVSARQAAAFIGLAVISHESGTSIHKRPRISKCGDPTMRSAMYFPGVSASSHNPLLKPLYQRLLAKGKTKMSAVTAVMRKLVHLAYGVLKHQTPFNPNYLVSPG